MRILSETEMKTVSGGNPIGPIVNGLFRAAASRLGLSGRNATAMVITVHSLSGSTMQEGTFNADDEYLDDTNTHATNQFA